MKNKKKARILSALAACAASCMIGTGAVAANAAETSHLRASDYIQYDADGNPYCTENNQTKTGKFSLQPDYKLGDIDSDGTVNAQDAASILLASAQAGAGTRASKALVSLNICDDEEQAFQFGDIDNDQNINASDAASVLTYAAGAGTGTAKPLGFTYYYANQDGILQTGFISDSATGETYYADQNYALYTGWHDINSKRYHFSPDGELSKQGWLKDGNKNYYIQEDGSALRDGWLQEDGDYYFDSSCVMTTGMTEIGSQLYYFNADGKMYTGWLDYQQQRYYFNPDGTAAAGSQTIDGKGYYFDEQHQLASGWREADGQKYYITETGESARGWTTIDAKKYYFNPETGAMQTGWLTVDGQKYSLDDAGVLRTGWFMQSGKTYYAPEGAVHTGWLESNGSKYYFSPEGVLQTGLQEIEGDTYYFSSAGLCQYGWKTVNGKQYYFSPETGKMITVGWVTEDNKTYYIDESGEKHTGWLTDNGKTYYLDDTTGERLSGWQELLPADEWEPDFDNQENWTDEEWDKYYEWRWGDLSSEKYYYYFSPQDFTMQTGWLTMPEGKYYLDEDGKRHFGFLEYNGKIYGFGEDGLMITNKQVSNGRYDQNGVFTKSKYDIPVAVRNMLDNATLNPGKRNITVYDRQYPKNGTPVEFTIKLSDRDYQIIEKFAAEHFSPDMTLSERLYETWWWIHCNVDYAYAGTKWNTIESKSYPDAIFNYKLGQCVQYNGAMAAVMAYYGFDVYMVKGWTNPPTNSVQHYWTEANINGTRYYIETGNQGKNGDYWQYFFVDAETVKYTKTGAFG